MTIEIDGVNNTLKTDKIEPQSGTALQISDSGDTVTLPSGATLTIAGTINASTGTATGFGDNLSWQTSDIKTSTFTAAAEKGYFVNTTGGAVTVNLPAGSAGAQIGLVDYAGTFDTNVLTISANGSEKIKGSTDDVEMRTERQAGVLTYVDATQGWVLTSAAPDPGISPNPFIVATGGTITTDGDFKVHTFNAAGTFTVSNPGAASGSNTVDYLIVAGGGSGAGTFRAGGGGAGGFRQNYPNPSTGGTPITATGYPIVVGAGGAQLIGGKNSGSLSSGFSITSAGGGGGGPYCAPRNGLAGGSGGGGAGNPSAGSGGAGNTPPVSPSQGNAGGAASSGAQSGGGGGGHTATGNAGGSGGTNGDGGVGTAITIPGASTTFAGGGGGGAYCTGNPSIGGTGGGGAGGVGSGCAPGVAGTVNTGGGGGGAGGGPGNAYGGAGGSGVVVIRYKFQ